MSSIKANTTTSPPSASTIALTATTGCHLLKVKGYSSYARLLRGKRFMSPKFSAAGHTWRIAFYPSDGNLVSLYPSISSTHATSGNADDEMPYNHRKIVRHTFRSSSSCNNVNMCGVSWFLNAKGKTTAVDMKYTDEEDDDDDSIVVRCDIKVMNKPAIFLHADSLEDLGLICHCKDDTCKRLHETLPAKSDAQPVVVNNKWAFARFFSYFLA
uniref:MATH domain-containing protein n=1 Tax=Oryza meridionalis TaxID=40149 RepID=A0A0E0F7V6_9ORYZ